MRARSGGWRPFAAAMSIRSLLIAFALALILPTLAFAGFLMWRVAKAEEAQVADSAQETAQQVTRAV